MEPRYLAPCKKTLVDRLKSKYNAIRAEVFQHVKGQQVALTHDGWTSLNTQSYDTVTCSFITERWELKCWVLSTLQVEGSHTGENIAESLKQVRKIWKLKQVVTVTDNAANEVKAFDILQWPRLSCLGHNINLAVKAGLKVSEVSKLIAKGSGLVSYFHRSPLATGVLLEKQKLLLDKQAKSYKLIGDCDTRWNSTLDMLTRLSELTPALHAVATDNSFKYAKDVMRRLYNCHEQSIVEALLQLLKPFKIATVLLSSEKSPTLSMVVPTLIKLERALQPTTEDEDMGCIKKVKKAMLENLNKRKSRESTEFYQMASLLDPRTKDIIFLSTQDKFETRERLLRDCLKITVEQEENTTLMTPAESSSETCETPDDPPLPNITISEEEDAQLSQTQADSQSDKCQSDSESSQGGGLVIYGNTLLYGDTQDSDSECQDKSQGQSSDFSQSPPAKLLKQDSDPSSWLDDIVCLGFEHSRSRPSLTQSEIIKKEIERYMEEVQIPNEECPLKWWSERQKAYPHIATVARNILAIPASSVPSERIFSIANNIVTKKRTQLSPENVDLLIFLKKNA
jgi:hypothetical protein